MEERGNAIKTFSTSPLHLLLLATITWIAFSGSLAQSEINDKKTDCGTTKTQYLPYSGFQKSHCENFP